MAATIKDIARETGLSLATISKYLNGGALREKNRIAIQTAIQKLDYHVNEYARGLKSNKSKTIGVVIPELSNLFITRIISVMEKILQEKGYSVVICDCYTDEGAECRCVQFLLEKRVDGIINMPVCKDGRHLLPAIEKKLPILLLDRPLTALSDAASCVLLDNQGAACTATGHLLEQGHRRVGIVVGPKDIYTSQLRLRGYQQALEQYGVPFSQELVAYGDYTLQGGLLETCRLLTAVKDMTALFVTNYEMTLGALIACNERGIRIPQELSLIGFDNMELSLVAQPKLTVVTQPLEEMGIQASQLMLGCLSKSRLSPAMIMLPAVLQQGQSVRKIQPTNQTH